MQIGIFVDSFRCTKNSFKKIVLESFPLTRRGRVSPTNAAPPSFYISLA
jgi:hypothetical protein